MFPQGIPLAWRQIASERKRFLTALLGICFGVFLMSYQLGIYQAIMKMCVWPHRALRGQLVMTSTNFDYFGRAEGFTRRRLYQCLPVEGVKSVHPLIFEFVTWRNPETQVFKQILAMAVDPDSNPFRTPEIESGMAVIRNVGDILYDGLSNESYGPVARTFRKSGVVDSEVNHRRVQVRGLYAMGQTLPVQASLIMSDQTFHRVFPAAPPHLIQVGIIELAPGADPTRVAERLGNALPRDVRIQSLENFADEEQTYWRRRTPVGFVTLAGMIVAMLVGGVIVYQILFTDVNDHLHEYATLKALGFEDRFFVGLVFQEAMILLGIGFGPGMMLTAGVDEITRRAANIPTELTPDGTAIVLGLSTVMCLLAGFLAIRKLRAANPAELF